MDSFAASRSGAHRTWRGRGSARGMQYPDRRVWRREEDDMIPQGSLLEAIPPDSGETISPASTDEQGIASTPAEFVGSYNWLESSSEPTLLIPGNPPRWTPLPQPLQLEPDSGEYFRDPNAARWPRYPTEPLVHTLVHLNPGLPRDEIDIVGCGSTLGNILRFAQGLDSSFHFKAEKVGHTLFLVRQEKSPKSLIEGVYGYGHTFPEAYTTWDKETRGSATHQRLVKYELDGLNILVRSEADGYLSEKDSSAETGAQGGRANHSSSAEPDELLSPLETSHIASRLPKHGSSLRIQRTHGKGVSQASVFDIKTRSIQATYNLEDILPRLWVNGTPNFVLGRHRKGKFEQVEVMDILDRLATWEEENAIAVKRFVEVLRELIEVVTSRPESKAGIWRRRNGALEVRTIDDEKWSVLPARLKSVWIGTGAGEGASEDEDKDESDSEDDSFLDF